MFCGLIDIEKRGLDYMFHALLKSGVSPVSLLLALAKAASASVIGPNQRR